MLNFIRALCVILFFGLLVACGGGGSDAAVSPPVVIAPPTTPPPSTPPPAPTMTLTLPDPVPVPPMVSLPAPTPPTGVDYRDNEFNINWGLGTINADAAYQRGYFGQGVTVAVVDSGVRGSHRNLADNIVSASLRFEHAIIYRDGVLTDPVRGIGGGRTVGSHGTGVANVIAGVFNKNDGVSGLFGQGVAPQAKILPMRFSDDVISTITTISGRIIDFHLRGDGRSPMSWAASGYSVHIINNSWGSSHTYVGHYGGDRSATIGFRAPLFPHIDEVLSNLGPLNHVGIIGLRDTFHNRDIVVVWAAGNDGWNSVNGDIQTYEVPNYEQIYVQPRLGNTYSPQQLIDNFVAVETVETDTLVSERVSITLNRRNIIDRRFIPATVDAFEPNGFAGYALAPHYYPELRGKWLAVVATDQNNRIASFSNGCGSIGKHWCIAAPGVGITTAYAYGDTWRTRASGTSFSAPHVSGALALLKSRFPQMPMSVLVHILLTTATDLGAPGVDDVYGHGLVNIARAITLQGNIRLPSSSAQGLLLQHSNTELPSSFSGFDKRLNGVGVAAEYLDGFYYDAPLGGMIRAREETKPPLDFAAGMFGIDETINDDGVFALSQNGKLQAAGWQNAIFQLRHNFYGKPSLWQGEGGDITRRPFFAHNNNGGGYSDEVLVNLGDNFQLFAARGEEQQAQYSQTGIQWHRQLSSIPKLRLAAAHSHIAEDNTLLGGKFGGLMPLTDGGNIRQTDIGGSYALDKRWRLFGNYQRADINAKLGGIVGDLSGVVAAGWSGGFAANNWLQKGDNFRIGIGRETRITGGEAVLNINQSSNPQKDESTQAVRNRGYQTTEQRIGLSQQTPLYLNAGYTFAPGDNSQLAIALNYRRQSSSALSIEWRWDF